MTREMIIETTKSYLRVYKRTNRKMRKEITGRIESMEQLHHLLPLFQEIEQREQQEREAQKELLAEQTQ
jgi:hypothetical protein